MEYPYHRTNDCLLVHHRITCLDCGYPASEARFATVEEYQEYEYQIREELRESNA